MVTLDVAMDDTVGVCVFDDDSVVVSVNVDVVVRVRVLFTVPLVVHVASTEKVSVTVGVCLDPCSP